MYFTVVFGRPPSFKLPFPCKLYEYVLLLNVAMQYLTNSSGFSRGTRCSMYIFVASLDLIAGVSNETNEVSLSGRYKDALNASRFAWFLELDDWVESITRSKASGAGFLIA